MFELTSSEDLTYVEQLEDEIEYLKRELITTEYSLEVAELELSSSNTELDLMETDQRCWAEALRDLAGEMAPEAQKIWG